MALAATLDVDRETGRHVAIELLAPAALAAPVYWYVADATLPEVGLFAVVFAVTLLVIQRAFGQRLDLGDGEEE